MQQIGLDAVLNNVPDFTDGIDKMNRAVDSFASNGKQAGADFGGGFGEIVTGALRKIGELSVQALLKAGQAITGFVKDSIGLAGDFQAQMLEFQSVAGKDVDTKGLEQFRDLFLDIGKRLPVSTSEVQQAAIEMVKGGIDPATIAAGGLEQNIKFASAAMGGDLVKAAEISSKILGGWTSVNATAAEKSDFLTHSTDMLAKAANASSTDVEGLSRGIFQAQGIAKTAGVSFDDLTTTLAELAPRFASSAESGTSLKNFIARMQPTTAPAIAAMEQLGLYTEQTGSAFYDAQGNFVGFQQASQLLQDSLQGLTKEQQAAALQTIFGNDAMSSAAALAELGAAGYTNMANALTTANGVQEAAALKQQGFNTALDNAKGSVEALQIQLGTFLLPILSDLLNNYIAPGVNAVTDFAAAFMKMTPAIAASDDPIQTFLNALKVAAPQFLDIISSIEDFKDALSEFATAAQPAVDFISNNLTPILVGIGTVIAVTVVPAMASAGAAFVAAAAPIAALAAAAALLYAGWESDFGGMRTAVTAFWTDTLLPALTDMQKWLAETIPPIIAALAKYWTDTLLPALIEVGDFLNDKVFPILSDLADVFIAGAIIEVKALAAIWTNVLQPALNVVWNFISGTLIPIFHALFDVEFAIAMKVGEALAGLWQKVIWPALKAVGEYITNTVLPAFQDIGNYLSATFGPILTEVGKWLDKVTGGFGGVSGALDYVIGKIEAFAKSISDIKLPSWLTPGSPTPWEIALYGIGKALTTSVGPGLATMQAGVKEIGTQISESFQDTDLIDMLTTLGQDAMEGFGAGLKAGLRGVMSIIDSAANSVEDAFRGALDAHSPARRFIPVGESVTQGIAEGIQQGFPALADQVGSIADGLLSKMQDVGTRINEAIADGFGSTASIDRQIAKNLDRFKDVLPQYQQYTQGALQEAQQQAMEFADPSEGAKFFKMRSDQILEYAKLQKDLNEATSQEDKNRIQQQMLLINRAQQAEISQFDATKSAVSPLMDIVNQINDIMKTIAGINLTDEQIHIVDQLASICSQLQTPVTTQRTPYNPGPATTNTHTTNLNMPIYTNNSPSAMQSSMAIAAAALM